MDFDNVLIHRYTDFPNSGDSLDTGVICNPYATVIEHFDNECEGDNLGELRLDWLDGGDDFIGAESAGVILRVTQDGNESGTLPHARAIDGGFEIHVAGLESARAFLRGLRGLIDKLESKHEALARSGQRDREDCTHELLSRVAGKVLSASPQRAASVHTGGECAF